MLQRRKNICIMFALQVRETIRCPWKNQPVDMFSILPYYLTATSFTVLLGKILHHLVNVMNGYKWTVQSVCMYININIYTSIHLYIYTYRIIYIYTIRYLLYTLHTFAICTSHDPASKRSTKLSVSLAWTDSSLKLQRWSELRDFLKDDFRILKWPQGGIYSNHPENSSNNQKNTFFGDVRQLWICSPSHQNHQPLASARKNKKQTVMVRVGKPIPSIDPVDSYLRIKPKHWRLQIQHRN